MSIDLLRSFGIISRSRVSLKPRNLRGKVKYSLNSSDPRNTRLSIGNSEFFLVKANLLHGPGRQFNNDRIAIVVEIADVDPDAIADDLLVKRDRIVLGSAQIDRQFVYTAAGEPELGSWFGRPRRRFHLRHEPPCDGSATSEARRVRRARRERQAPAWDRRSGSIRWHADRTAREQSGCKAGNGTQHSARAPGTSHRSKHRMRSFFPLAMPRRHMRATL